MCPFSTFVFICLWERDNSSPTNYAALKSAIKQAGDWGGLSKHCTTLSNRETIAVQSCLTTSSTYGSVRKVFQTSVVGGSMPKKKGWPSSATTRILLTNTQLQHCTARHDGRADDEKTKESVDEERYCIEIDRRESEVSNLHITYTKQRKIGTTTKEKSSAHTRASTYLLSVLILRSGSTSPPLTEEY